MAVGLVHDDRFAKHETGPTHPERPARLAAIHKRLQADGWLEKLTRIEPKNATIDAIGRVHDTDYIQRVRQACAQGQAFMDSPDSPICKASYDIALLAAGGVMQAVDQVMAGKVDHAFCAVRPPGHHAEHKRAMGFCLFNNIAIAAEHLIDTHQFKRIAIIDFDVHHGNGTQHSFEDRADVLFMSCHEHPKFQFPGTGYEHERGSGDGLGYTVNCPMMPGSGDAVAHDIFTQTFLPKLAEYKPQFLLISAGFDAIESDPLGGLTMTYKGFVWMAQQLKQAAAAHCEGRVVSVLEGGYDLNALARCVSEHIGVLAGKM